MRNNDWAFYDQLLQGCLAEQTGDFSNVVWQPFVDYSDGTREVAFQSLIPRVESSKYCG